MSPAARVLAVVAVLGGAAACGAAADDGRYAGLVTGARWTYELHYRVEGRFPMEQEGRTRMTIPGVEERAGHRYHRVETTSTGFRNLPDAITWTRVAEDGVRTLEDAAGSEEVLVLPLPARPGRTWSVGDGDDVWRYTLEASGPIEVPAGRFDDCVSVVARLESQASKFAITERADLCAGVGRVRTRAEATFEHGVAITERTLVAFER